MSNLEIIQLKENLINVLNDSLLPVVAKQLILADVQGIISSLVPGAIESERQTLEQEGEKDGQSI